MSWKLKKVRKTLHNFSLIVALHFLVTINYKPTFLPCTCLFLLCKLVTCNIIYYNYYNIFSFSLPWVSIIFTSCLIWWSTPGNSMLYFLNNHFLLYHTQVTLKVLGSQPGHIYRIVYLFRIAKSMTLGSWVLVLGLCSVGLIVYNEA